MPRRRLLVLGAVVAPLLFSGCTPRDEVGVRFDTADRPVVVDCGTYIGAVSVTDADTGRVVWAARVRAGNDGEATMGRVAVGVVPGSGWTETSPFEADPLPRTWRFRVRSISNVVIDVRAASIRTDRVYRSGARSETRRHFSKQTCSGIPLSRNQWFLALDGLALATAAGIALGTRRKRGHA